MLSVPLTKKSITFISAPVPYLQLSYLGDDTVNCCVTLGDTPVNGIKDSSILIFGPPSSLF